MMRRQLSRAMKSVRSARLKISQPKRVMAMTASTVVTLSFWAGGATLAATEGAKREAKGGVCNVLRADSDILNRMPDVGEFGSYVKFEVITSLRSPDEEWESGERFLVFVDNSKSAQDAVNQALRLKKPGDQLHVFHCHRLFRDDTLGPGVVISPRITPLTVKDTKHVIDHICCTYAEVLSEADNYELSVLTSFHPRETVARLIRELQPTHLFCGSRNLGFLQRLFSGSFSRDLLDKSPCSITIVKGDTHEVNPEPEFAVESADYGEPRYLKRIAK